MKTLLITVGEATVVRNLMRSDFWQVLREDTNLHIVLVMLPELAESYRKEFESDRVVVAALALGPPSYFEKMLIFLARNGFRSGTHSIMRHRARLAGESKTPVWIKEVISFIFEHIYLLRALVRRGELSIAPAPALAALFDEYKPNIVFSGMLTRAAPDVAVMREARRQGIKTVGMVRGWDNLTTYGFLRVLPDKLYVQNDFLKESAVQYHDIAPDAISIVGTPNFDSYTSQALRVSREEFCKNLGIDAHKKIILYAAIGDFLFPHEGEVADVFEGLIEKGPLQGSTVLFRAHPAFESPLERMKILKHVVPDRSADYRSSGKGQWDMQTAQTAHLINSILHADVVVTAGSTMMIEAALMHKPVVSVAFDGNTKERYWFSIARFHQIANHIVALLKTGGVRVAHSPSELGEIVAAYLNNPKTDEDKRAKLVERFAGPNHGTAAKILGKLVREDIDKVA